MMEKKTQAGSKIAEIARRVVALLDPLSSEDRQKVINGSLTLLGETSKSGASSGGGSGVNAHETGASGKADHNIEGISVKAQNWLRQNGLTSTQIEQVFDIRNGSVSVIASDATGKNGKERTRNAYVLQGLGRFLASGDAAFDDKDARKLCEDLGCYNAANHAAYMEDKGNVLTGSKASGWKVTAPGLKHGAELVKKLTKEG